MCYLDQRGKKKARSNHPPPFRRCARLIGRLAGASRLTKTQRPPCASKSRRSSSKDDEKKTGCARRSAASGVRAAVLYLAVCPATVSKTSVQGNAMPTGAGASLIPSPTKPTQRNRAFTSHGYYYRHIPPGPLSQPPADANPIQQTTHTHVWPRVTCSSVKNGLALTPQVATILDHGSELTQLHWGAFPFVVFRGGVLTFSVKEEVAVKDFENACARTDDRRRTT